MRLFVVVLVMAITASTQAMAFGPRHQRDTRKAKVNEGCSAAFYRGSGGNCIHNPDYPKEGRGCLAPAKCFTSTISLDELDCNT